VGYDESSVIDSDTGGFDVFTTGRSPERVVWALSTSHAAKKNAARTAALIASASSLAPKDVSFRN
jgi:hypothetical protein